MYSIKYLQSLTDEEVIIFVRTKNIEAFAEVIRRYQTKLLRYARYLIGDEAMAADVVQESFIKVYENLHGFNAKKKFSSWMYRIVHNQALNSVKMHKKFVTLEVSFNKDENADLTDAFIKKELIENAQTCIDTMPLLYREPLTLFYLEDKSYNELSDILRVPVSTVGTRVRRAKVLLRKLCQTKK